MKASKAIPGPRRRALSTDRLVTLGLHILAGATLLLLVGFVGHIAWSALSEFKPELLAFSPTGIGNQFFIRFISCS